MTKHHMVGYIDTKKMTILYNYIQKIHAAVWDPEDLVIWSNVCTQTQQNF